MADFGEDIAVSLVPDFTRFDQEYRAEVERLQHNPISIPVKLSIDKAKLKADLEAAARELSRTTEIRVQVKLDTTAARAELARLRAEARIGGGGGGGGGIGGALGGAAGGAGAAGGGLASLATGPAGLAVGALVLGGPAIGAATTAVTGLAGALGTAKLAYQGLQTQAARGQGFGAGIANEISDIKTELNGLAQVAANALGPGLQKAFGALRDAIPGLAPEVDKMGRALGVVADNLSTGLVSAVQNAGPLFQSFEQVITGLSKDFADFTASKQFKQFIDYAAAELPKVVQDLKDFGKVALQLAADLQPVGDAVLTLADDVARLASALLDLGKGDFAGAVRELAGLKLPSFAPELSGALGGGGSAAGGAAGGSTREATAAANVPFHFGGAAPSNFQKAGNFVFNIIPATLHGLDSGPTQGYRGITGGASYVTVPGIGPVARIPDPGTSTNQDPIRPMNGLPTPPFMSLPFQYAGIGFRSQEGRTLRTAITTPAYGGPTDTVPGLNVLESRYGPAIQAMQNYRTAQEQVKAAVKDENQVEIQGAQQVSAAQAALAQARTQAARTAVADARAVKAAQQGIADAQRNVADTAHQNAEAITSAERQVTQAQENATDAQKGLTQAREDAARSLQDMARAAVDSGDSLQSAQLHLEQLQLQQAARLGTKTPEEIFREYNQLTNRQNTLDLKSAQDQVTDAQIAHTRAVHDNNQAQKKGVEGSDQVVAAKKAIKNANEALTASEQALKDTRHAAKEAELTANRQLQTSEQALSDARVQQAQDRKDAENNVATAITGVKNAENNAKQADNDAHDRTVAVKNAANSAGDAFDYEAGKVGLTTTQVQSLSSAIDKGKFDLVASFKAKNAQQVMQDTINVQRELYEAVLIAGGTSPGEARRTAQTALPYPKAPSDPGTPTNTGDRPPPPPPPPVPQGPVKHFVVGGPVYGPGGPTDDLAGVFALSAGEHVWTAKEVQNAGGHKAVEDMRAYYRGMAEGGEVPTEADGPTIDFRKMRLVGRLRAYASGLIGAGGPGGAGGGGAGEGAVWGALRAAGFSAVVAAGIMGNIQSETSNSWSPYIIQGGARSRDPRDAGGGGYGLVQWTPGSKLIPYLNGQAASIATEVAALAAQLRGQGPSPESAVGRALRGASSPSDAAVLFGTMYERYSGAIQGQRSTQAEQIYAYYGGAGRPGGGMPGDGAWTPTGGFNVMPGTYTPPWPRPVYHKLSSNTARAASFVRHHFGLDSYPDQTRVDQFDHPWGKATDNMIPNYGSTAGINKGWQVANWFADNPHVFGTKYILWRSSQSDGSGWSGPGVEGHYNHVHTSFYDEGGVLPPGTNVVVNSSNKPEAVLTNAQWRVLKSLGSGRRGPVMHVENQIIQSPAEADALVRMLQFAALAAGGGGL